MNFQKSADAKIIETVLEEAKVGETITYDALTKAIGRDVREHAISALGTARRGVFKEKGYVFEVEKNVGLVRLGDSAIVNSMESDRRKMQRTAKRSLQKLAVVDFDQLPEEQKKQHVVASAQIGTIAMFAEKSSTRRIEKNVDEKDTSTLAIGETLKMFS